MENGPKELGRYYYEPSNLSGMKVKHLNYNNSEKRWIRAGENDFSHMKAQGADFSDCDWNQMNIADANLSAFQPSPSHRVIRQENYENRKTDLTLPPIWSTIKQPTKTKLNGGTWRNVDAQGTNLEGAEMMNMSFPAEMETIDAIPVPKAIEPAPVLLELKPRLRKKTPVRLEDVEFQQPYLTPTSEIPFTGADLKHTNWAGTCLNAISKLDGAAESRLNFERLS
jgi:hypothetical protein